MVTKNTTQTYLTSVEAAAYLNVAVSTLRQWRHRNQGPKYRKQVGVIQYSLYDLEKWLKSSERNAT